jgi:hypothetical protein
MATNRPLTPLPALYYESSSVGSSGLKGYLTSSVNGITMPTNQSAEIIYTVTTQKDAAVSASDLNYRLLCSATNGTSRVDSSTNIVTSGEGSTDMIFSIPATGFAITSLTIQLFAARSFIVADGDMVFYKSITIPIIEHPGNTFLFITQANTFLRLPFCNAAINGGVFFIKNTTTSIVTIAPHWSQPTIAIESTSYTLNGYPQLRLQEYQCVGLLCNGTQWFVVSFYTGAGTGQARNGYSAITTTEVAASDITSNIIYSSINSKDLRVNLPAPSSRQLLMIIAERTQNMFGYQLQLNQPASGTLIDGRWSELNLNITSNRHGACAIFLISNGSTWYVASMFDMTDMDNFGTASLITTASVTSAIGINTTGAVTSNVWSGRSYDTTAVTPFPLSDGTAVFRIFKENNSAVSNGIGLKASDGSALFTNSYSGPNYDNSNTQMFIYGSNTFMAMLGLEIKRPGVANRIYFLGQYPTRF